MKISSQCQTLHLHHSVYWSSNILEQEELKKIKNLISVRTHVNTWSVYSLMCVLILEVRCCCHHCVRREHLAASVHQLGEGEGGHAHLSALRSQPQPVDPDRSGALPQTAVSGTTLRWRLETVTVVQTVESQQEENTTSSGTDWYSLIMNPKWKPKPWSWRCPYCLLWTITPTRMKKLHGSGSCTFFFNEI